MHVDDGVWLGQPVGSYPFAVNQAVLSPEEGEKLDRSCSTPYAKVWASLVFSRVKAGGTSLVRKPSQRAGEIFTQPSFSLY
jgi:hypothetical protein